MGTKKTERQMKKTFGSGVNRGEYSLARNCHPCKGYILQGLQTQVPTCQSAYEKLVQSFEQKRPMQISGIYMIANALAQEPEKKTPNPPLGKVNRVQFTRRRGSRVGMISVL